MSPVGATFVPFPTKTGTNLLHPLPPQLLNCSPWWDTTCVEELLRPFDPGKGCQRDARRGKAIIGVDLPFDRGKSWGRMQHGG